MYQTMYRRGSWFFSALLSLIIVLVLLGGIRQVQSQEKYPTRAIDIIVPFAPGGATDLSARVLAAYMNKKWGVPVNVINKPGGNTIPACLEVYSARPDGYTLLEDGNASSIMLPVVVRDLPFKVMDRTFIGIFSESSQAITVPSESPFKSLKDLETAAKKDPENFTWTSLGGASTLDYVVRQFLKAIGVDVFKTKPIMSKGAAQAIVLIAAGNVKMGTGSIASSLTAIRAGTARPLAVTSGTRFPDLPEVPTTAELGYPTVTAKDRYGPSGPPKLPSYIVDIWNKAMEEMLKDPETISKMRNIGLIPLYLNSHETIEYVIKKTEEVRELWGLK